MRLVFGCWPFIGGGSVLVDTLFIVAHFVCGDLCSALVLLFSTLCPSFAIILIVKRERERWLLNFNCLPDVLLLLIFCRSSSRCPWFAMCVCGVL